MTDVGDNGMFEREEAVAGALDLDGAQVGSTGREERSAGADVERDADGSLVGEEHAAADEAASRGETI
jgi:hypothetical protein